ncbi:MAG: zinc ribbon domain-containing protein [Bacteroidales bacterium]|nr:zinc ribbon domain-containing protein [Bacteroidales bacterium]
MAEELENKPVENNAQTEVTPEDVQNNKVFAILAYFGILVLVPIFAAKESKFARFHANQGLGLFICEAAWGIISYIISYLLAVSFSWAMLGLWSVISWLVCIGFLVFAIIGIVYAAQGNTKPLPIFGKFKILK